MFGLLLVRARRVHDGGLGPGAGQRDEHRPEVTGGDVVDEDARGLGGGECTQHVHVVVGDVGEQVAAWRVLNRTAKVAPGQTIIVFAAAGGVGSVLVRLAVHAGIG